MKPHFSRFLISICCCAAVLVTACSKKDKQDGDDPGGPRLSLRILLGTPDFRRWWISEVKLSYYDPSGKLDSTVLPKLRELESTVTFLVSPATTPKEVCLPGYPLSEYIPGESTFVLNEPAQTLTFNCTFISRRCPDTDKDGTWKVKSYGKTGYGESIEMEREFPLPGGRKLRVWTRLFGDVPPFSQLNHSI